MKKSAVIIHLDGIPGLVPLVGGYLKASALAEPDVRDAWDIELYRQGHHVKASIVISDMVRRAPDLVAFSVYTWNAGIVRRLLPVLRGLLPRTRFLLGGVEVASNAPRFVDRTWENFAVCDGEGEQTFRELLRELSEPRPDWQRVGGLTFARDGAWCTTTGKPRIQDLAELPSPWLTGVFDGFKDLEIALFETNRGCPFACEFCYWGGAIGQKVYAQDDARVREEITYIGKRGMGTLSLCDANFGILPRDAGLAEHMVATMRKYGKPRRIMFNSSKVRPDRVEEISRILFDGEMLARHVFSLETLSPRALEVAKRTSLAREPYQRIQRALNARRMNSLIELLWPMPGETLDSFKDGMSELIEVGAQAFLAYPLVWLNNIGYREHTEEYGVTLLPEDDPAGGAELVVTTNEVPFPDYVEGLRFIAGAYVLHDCRALHATMQLAAALGVARPREIVDAFVRFVEAQPSSPFVDHWRAQLACFEDMIKYTWRGEMSLVVLNSQRADADRLIRAFATSQPQWFEGPHGDLLREAVDYDLLARPYFYVQDECRVSAPLERLVVLESKPRAWLVRAHYDIPALVEALRTGTAIEPAQLEPHRLRLRIDHRSGQLFLMPNRTAYQQAWHLTQMMQEVCRIEPRCSAEGDAEVEASGAA